jgi:predicted Zn-dependent peptidase
VDTLTWRFPAAQTTVLDNGLRLRLVDVPGKFVATVAITLAIPTSVETPETEGVVAAWAAMLLLDAPFGRADEVSGVARIGAGVTTGSDHRGPKIIADCPVTELDSLFAALAPALFTLEPTQPSFDLVRSRRLAEFALETHDSFALANKLLNESVLAPSSRYARSVAGTAGSWEQRSVDDVVELQHTRVDPQQTTVIVVGDLSVLDVRAAASAAFGRHPSSGAGPVPDDVPQPGGPPQLTCRPGRDGAQTQLMIGGFATDRLDPRWPSARVLAELLGGGVDGLLDAQLRGRHGLTYGVDVKFLPYHRGGLFTVAGKVDDAGSEDAVALILSGLADVHAGRLDPGHFERVRDRMVRGAPEIYESTLAVAQQYAELESCGIAADYIDAHLAQLRALEFDEVCADAATLIDPDLLHVVVVGRFDAARTRARAAIPTLDDLWA